MDAKLNTTVLDGSEEEQEMQLKLWLGLSLDQSFADLPDIPEDLDESENGIEENQRIMHLCDRYQKNKNRLTPYVYLH